MGPDTEQPNYEKQAVAQSRDEGANWTDVLAADKRDAERYHWLRENMRRNGGEAVRLDREVRCNERRE